MWHCQSCQAAGSIYDLASLVLGGPYGRGRLHGDAFKATRKLVIESARVRCSPHTAARDLALIQVLGGAGLRSHEARELPVDPFDQGRSDNHDGGSVYLRVRGKGNKLRSVPLYSDVADALERWRELRDEIAELAGDPHLSRAWADADAMGAFPMPAGRYPPAL
jgi:integrase